MSSADSIQTTQATADSGSSDRRSAIFDLDRTLLIGASSPILARRCAAREWCLAPRRASEVGHIQGVRPDRRDLPVHAGQPAGARVGRLARRRSRGRRWAAEPLTDAVLPYARQLIDEHRTRGACWSWPPRPPDLIRPRRPPGLRRRRRHPLRHRDGRYDGTIDGEFVWDGGNQAVSQWVLDNDVDLLASYAYSDSWYDTLLSIVSHPHRGEPRPRMLGMATVRRWPVVPSTCRRCPPSSWASEPQVLFALAQPPAVPHGCASTWAGSTTSRPRVPPSWWATTAPHGPTGHRLHHRRRGRPVRASSARRVFDALRSWVRSPRRSGVRVDRGTGSDARCGPPRGGPRRRPTGGSAPGDHPRGPAFFDPELAGPMGCGAAWPTPPAFR